MALIQLNNTQFLLAGKTTADLTENTNLYYTDARVRANTLNQLAAPTTDLDLSAEKIINLADGTGASDAVNKGQLDNAIAGLHWKESVRVATTGAGTLASSFANGSTVDGISLVTGDRILIKDQASQVENGIYVVKASGAPDRSSDANTNDEMKGAAMFVREGTANADSAWVCSTDVPNVGVGNIAFSQFSGGGSLVGGAGITITGNSISIGAGAIAHSMLAASIPNANLANSSVNFGGVTVALGASDTTPAFDLQHATGLPTTALTGTITNAQLAGSITNARLVNQSVSYGGVALNLGGVDNTPAFNLSDATAYPTSALVGTVSNAQLTGSISGDKISFTGKQETITGNGSTTEFTLASNATSAHLNAVKIYMNGMRLEKKATLSTGPAIATEYKVTQVGAATKVTFGVAPLAADFFYADYWA